jgi:hypothetical protein
VAKSSNEIYCRCRFARLSRKWRHPNALQNLFLGVPAMNRMWKLLIVVMYPVIALAQTGSPRTSQLAGDAPYQPAVPASSVVSPYGGWSGGYSGGTTAAGSAMNGMASMISAQGNRNLANSAAAVNMTQAQKNEIQNRQQWTNTYFEMRQVNQQQAAAARGPAPTMEQIARIAKAGVPKPLAQSQQDQVSGQLRWPGALQQESFKDQRADVDRFVATHARYGTLSYEDQMKLRKIIVAMSDQLNAQLDQIPPQDYTTCRSFLKSLLYSTTKTLL